MNQKTDLNYLLTAYGESHQNPTNQWIHKICVPLITWSLLGLLDSLPQVLGVSIADIFAAMALGYYVQFHNRKVLIGALLLLLPFWLYRALHLPYLLETSLAVFVVAWIGQFVGHKIEGKKPSFLTDIFFLLIGPLWVIETVLRKFKQSLLT